MAAEGIHSTPFVHNPTHLILLVTVEVASPAVHLLTCIMRAHPLIIVVIVMVVVLVTSGDGFYSGGGGTFDNAHRSSAACGMVLG